MNAEDSQKESLKESLIYFRLQAANSSLSERSVHVLLERGLVPVGTGRSESSYLSSRLFLLLVALCFSPLQDLGSPETFDFIL